MTIVMLALLWRLQLFDYDFYSAVPPPYVVFGFTRLIYLVSVLDLVPGPHAVHPRARATRARRTSAAPCLACTLASRTAHGRHARGRSDPFGKE